MEDATPELTVQEHEAFTEFQQAIEVMEAKAEGGTRREREKKEGRGSRRKRKGGARSGRERKGGASRRRERKG